MRQKLNRPLRKFLFYKFFIVVFLLFLGFFFHPKNNSLSLEQTSSLLSNSSKTSSSPERNTQNVLAANIYQPHIVISGGQYNFGSGGMIALASTDEPAVYVNTYSLSGEAQITLYNANDTMLFNYLIHDKNGKQTQNLPDTTTLQQVITFKQTLNSSEANQDNKITLPLTQTGIWYITVKIAGKQANGYIIRSNVGILTKEAKNELVFWGQNFATKRSVNSGTITSYNLQDASKTLQTATFDNNGIAKLALDANADIAYYQQGDEKAIVPLNLRYLNDNDYGTYKQFFSPPRQTRYFMFTDRPLYKPGDLVNFKAIVRDDDDARYTIPNDNITVKIYNGYMDSSSPETNLVIEKQYPVSSDGTISGNYQLPADAKVGNYTMYFSNSEASLPFYSYSGYYTSDNISFDVEYYKKPQYTIDVTTPKTELISQDKTSFTIKGAYFSGQPLAGEKITYTVSSNDYYEYTYLNQAQQITSSNLPSAYGYNNAEVKRGDIILDQNGEATITVDTKLSDKLIKSQVFTFTASVDNDPSGTAVTTSNILVYRGEYSIYRKDTTYGLQTDTPLSLPLQLFAHQKGVNLSNIPLKAKIHRVNWIAYSVPGQKYPSYKKDEEDLPSVSATTDSQGNAVVTFTPTKIGSYTITVSGQDNRGNTITNDFYTYASSTDQSFYTSDGDNNLSINIDKNEYAPTDTAQITIYSTIPDRDVFLSFERGRMDRYQIVHLTGNSGSVSVPLINTDIPNMYASIESFSESTLDTTQTNLTVSTESKKLVVQVAPNSKVYGPGETATMNITTTDTYGNPVSAEVALWTIDKAIFSLSGNTAGNIFDTFWSTRYDATQQSHSLEGIVVLESGGKGGGCFAPGTKILMADGTQKNIESVKEGDYILTRSENEPQLIKEKVLSTHQAQEAGYLIINNNLKITADHILRVNNKWEEAGSIQPGDILTNKDGKPVKVMSVEWQQIKTQVYNLEIQNYHTFFANGIWVHNDKGSPRSNFKDTAYWNPSIHTDATGKAQVSFMLPDDLTTWEIAAVATTPNTQVGQTTQEITTTKNVIIRPIIPSILRTGDTIRIGALVQNFTQKDYQFNTTLSFDSGSVQKASQTANIKANAMQQVYWTIHPTKNNSQGQLTFTTAATSDNSISDAVIQQIPVQQFGFEETTGETGIGSAKFNTTISSDAKNDKASVTISLAPTILGTLTQATEYLIQYPYGCVEQTTSRFVPAVIAKENPSFFQGALQDKNIDDIIQKGLSRLQQLQQPDGGWSWWYMNKSNSFISAYVVKYLLEAQKTGFAVDKNMLDHAQQYFENSTSTNDTDSVSKAYALTLLNSNKKIKEVNQLKNVSPDILSYAVMNNYLNGDSNPETNGLTQLLSLAHHQGDAIYWGEGNEDNFGSIDASTALAIQAMNTAKEDQTIIQKAVKYLAINRKNTYWGNTFATAQVLKAFVDIGVITNELNPSYIYTVSLNNQLIANNSVSSPTQVIKDITIPANKLLTNNTTIAVTQKGKGQLYSTLLLSQFHTDTNTKSLSHGITIEREYLNQKGSYTFMPGDTAIVKLTVSGLSTPQRYAVIHDELPSGLIPINENFLNEQTPQNQTFDANYEQKEVTQSGMNLTFDTISNGTYTYLARVVNAGSYTTPPATILLMYSPDIYGRSDVQKITVDQTSHPIITQISPKSIKQTTQLTLLFILLGIAVIGVAFLIQLKRHKNTMSKEQNY